MFRILKGILFIIATWPKARRLKNVEFKERYAVAHQYAKQFFEITQAPIEHNTIDLPEGPILFVSNHQGTMDPLVIVAALSKPITFISKKENKKIPIINTWAENLELIYFDRDDQSSAIKMLRETSRWLKAGKSVLIFPEGTRSKSAQVNLFHEASLKPAYLSKATVVPLTLHNVYKDFENIKTKSAYQCTIGEPILFEYYKDKEIKCFVNELHGIIEDTINKTTFM